MATVAMNRRDAFVGYLQDALAHLYDRPHLEGHPLGSILTERPIAGDKLRGLLLDAIEQLRPPQPCPPSSPAWRSHRYLVLRYVEGMKRRSIANELQVSIRQSQREHHRALDELAALMWPLSDGASGPDHETESSAGSDAADLLKVGAMRADEPVNLAETMRDATRIVEKFAEQRGGEVVVDIAAPLPPVLVNRVVLRQVLVDLMTSALDSCPRAGVRILAVDAVDTIDVEVVVPGCDSEGRQEFSDAEARLAACRTLIGLQGGALVVSPREGFAFHAVAHLPLSPTSTLLVVDDNPDVAYLFARFLEDHRYRVLHASTGRAALQLARQASPDAITLDVLMPSQDGWDTLRQLANDPATRDVPVIMCSVLPERSLALSLGVQEFLSKPVTREALLTVLKRSVPTKGAGRRRARSGSRATVG
jgi:CheY-like chemotaxis protein